MKILIAVAATDIKYQPVNWAYFRKLVRLVDPDFKMFAKSDPEPKSYRCLGAFEGSTLVGCLALQMEPAFSFPAKEWLAGKNEVAFADILVLPAYQSRGIGRTLLTKTREFTSSTGRQLFYAVDKTNLASKATAAACGLTELDPKVLSRIPESFRSELSHLVWYSDLTKVVHVPIIPRLEKLIKANSYLRFWVKDIRLSSAESITIEVASHDLGNYKRLLNLWALHVKDLHLRSSHFFDRSNTIVLDIEEA